MWGENAADSGWIDRVSDGPPARSAPPLSRREHVQRAESKLYDAAGAATNVPIRDGIVPAELRERARRIEKFDQKSDAL
jgi:hypothetical protein